MVNNHDREFIKDHLEEVIGDTTYSPFVFGTRLLKEPGGRVRLVEIVGDFFSDCCETIPNLLVLRHGSADIDAIYRTSCYVVMR